MAQEPQLGSLSAAKRLFARQLAKASGPSGALDVAALEQLVVAAYDQANRDRDRTDRSISLMVGELERAQAHLLDALEVAPQGVALFDAEDRYVLWNQRYTELYQLSADHIAVGMRFEDTLRAGLARQQYLDAVGREEEWLAERMARHAQPQSTFEQRLPNGRWVRVEERRTPDGGSIGVRVDITDLKNREDSFRLLFDANPVPMWVIDRESFKFIAVNDAAVAHYGYSRAQFLNMTILDFRPEEDREAVAGIVNSRRDIVEGNNTFRHRKADGTVIDVSIYRCFFRYQGVDASLVCAIDNTERKRAADDLKRAEQFLNTIVEHVPASLVVKNADDGRYVLANRGAESFYGIPRAQLIGRTAFDCFAQDHAERVRARDQEVVRSGQPMVIEDETLDIPGKGTRLVRSNRVAVFDEAGAARYVLIISEDTTEQKQAQDRIAYLAHHDPLTDLPNRTSLNEVFEATVMGARASAKRFAVLCIDFDRFKEINDVFGPSVGDALIGEMAERMKSAAADAFLARASGDEFVALVNEGAQPESALALAERLQQAAARAYEVAGERLKVGLSIGVAVFPTDGEDAATLLGNANAALHRAKAEGRGNIRFFRPETDQRLREKRALQHDLQAAMKRDEIFLNYQPQTLSDGEVIGFEALVRWQHPVRGLIPPGTFIPIAEESRLITHLGEWILRESCREAALWPKPLRIAVNLSPLQFAYGDLPDLVGAVLRDSGLAPDRLELEVTEGVLIGDSARAIAILRRLKALGVRVVMDDFGAGYSSLSYLQAFPFDKIKIDRSFVMKVHENRQSAVIVRSIIGLCHGLGLTVVAEGVELEEQRMFLARECCDELQGFLFGVPASITDYADLVGRQRAPRLARSAV